MTPARRKGRSSPSRGRLHAVILAGGAGERFWPASRQRRPKPFLKVIGGKSLLDVTLSRARRAASRGCVWIVCGRDHVRDIRRESGLPASRVLVEPTRRNTAMAAAFAAERIRAEDPGAVLAVLPADHHIPDAGAFADAIRRAAAAAREFRVLVTLGVVPTRPDIGYGYIRRGAAVGRDAPGLFHVRRFVEKPDAARARRYLRQGDYFWNAGIFVWRADVLLEEVARHAPEIDTALGPIRNARRPTAAAIARAYRRAPSAPIDVAVLERSDRIWTLPADFRWSDVGTWESLADELGVAAGQSRIIEGRDVIDDLGGNLVWGSDRPIVLLGVEGLAVVDTGDALLVAKLDESPRVREAVAKLKSKGRSDVT